MRNYFNYFTEIEERFQQRRGSLLLLSTLDWALIEMWQEAGVPLEALLRQTAQTMLSAIDAKDPTALVAAGGNLDEVCESCHMTFWYPNQVIPAFPKKGEPRYERIAVNPTR